MNGQFFQTAHGPHTVIGTSDFWLFGHFALDRDIAPVVDERLGIGFNDFRVFLGMKGSLGEFDPRPHLDRLPAFCQYMGSRGARLELTVFPDVDRWERDHEKQRWLLHAVEERILPYAAWTRIEGMNEGDNQGALNYAGGILHERLDPRILWALGSRIQDAGTMLPHKNYGTFHPSRTSDWPRKVGHGAMEDVGNPLQIPCVSNETMRPDQNSFQERNFFDAAANATLLCAGATFHSTAGKASVLFPDNERRCAEAWVAGAQAVPLQYQRGRYTAGHLHDSPLVHRDEWASRTHARILGDTACCSVPQQQAGWKLEPRGWRVVNQNGSVIELAR